MKKGLIVGGVIALLLIMFIGGIGSSYNSMNAMGKNVDKAQADVQTQLQRRNDLIGNLVETVKGYTNHEEKVFADISNARAKMAGAGNDVAKQNQTEGQLTGALSRLLMLQENYPNLKADTQFTGLRDELTGTENRIAFYRNKYNDAANGYNTKVTSFPSVIFANMFGFHQKDLYKAQAGAENAPKVKF